MADTDPNKLFRVRLGQGEAALRFLLSKRDAEAAELAVSKNDGKSPNRTGARNLQPRRKASDRVIPKKKVGGFVTFWDLGQLANGDTLDYEAALTFDDSTATIESDVTTTEWEGLFDKIFEISETDWASDYKQLGFTDAERYGVDVLNHDFTGYSPLARNASRLDYNGDPITATKWESGGLKLAGPSLSEFFIASGVGFIDFGNDPDHFKITTTPNYADSGTTLTLQPNDKVFLVPIIVIYLGKSEDAGDDISEVISSGVVRPFNRAFYLANLKSDGAFLFTYNSFVGVTGSVVTHMIGEIKYLGERWVKTGATISPDDPAGFPIYTPTTAVGYAVPAANLNAAGIAILVNTQARYEGMLSGVIQRGSTFYYFWSLGPTLPINAFTDSPGFLSV